jgi:hypothetical protein
MRTSRFRAILACAACICAANQAGAQSQLSAHTLKLDKSTTPPKAKVADLAWIQGRWTGEAFGGTAEEVWSPPLGNTMLGMFRLVKDGKAVFYEICTFIEENDTVLLRLKHFHPDLKGWEEKDVSVSFPLIKLTKDTVWFDGLTFQKEPDGSLLVYLMIQPKNGKAHEEKFHYRRE